MFKRLFGIHKIEKNVNNIGTSLNRSWEWINHLNTASSAYEDRILRLEKTNIELIDAIKELMNKMQPEEPVSQTVESSEEEYESVPQVDSAINLPDKDLFLVNIIYQYASFDKSNAIDTNTLFQNLPYKITSRGLRKKLNTMVVNGLLKTYKRGNVRYWYLNAGALARIKKALKTKE
ncbi:MAG: hypothetical protein WC307_00165 [Candidatus Nanoarchaeia archaeon]|jgi:hypothetical protein